ncbi:type II toxin-antitoxin system HicB family antitoxin [Hyphomicrobium sp. ghe19]|uniref:type II toxin-antitoxin system HicB family antitoxin n=1 Tax=Hyphomicrobium sp. ghe19 TaxID=2682968 RepID=UPI0013675269|nr:hypothetical protein HYPP_03797 [Hyphomicrobium sp. ghe19]
MAYYTAILHRGGDDSIGVSFPDLPGCIAQGDSVDAALVSAEDAATFHVEGLIEAGEAVPVARSLDALRADPEFFDDFAGNIAVVLVPLTIPSRSVRVNLTFDENLLAAIDRAAERTGASRSGFLADAARAKLTAA